MKTVTVVLLSLFTSCAVWAAGEVTIPLACGTNDSREFRAAGYLVGNPKLDLKGAAKVKDENESRKILEIVNPDPKQESTYEKAFDFGNFRWVRNKEATKGWDVYQRASPTSSWVKLDPTPHEVRIDDKQNLYVKIFSKAQLTVLRKSATDSERKDFYIYTTTDKITIKGTRETSRAAHYTFGHCKGSAPASRPAAKKAIGVKS